MTSIELNNRKFILKESKPQIIEIKEKEKEKKIEISKNDTKKIKKKIIILLE